MEILRGLRERSCTDEDISDVQILVLNNKEQVAMFLTSQLNRGVVYIILITPRRSDGMRPWQNIAAPREILVGYVYLVHAEDRLSKTEVPLCARVEVAGPDDRSAGRGTLHSPSFRGSELEMIRLKRVDQETKRNVNLESRDD